MIGMIALAGIVTRDSIILVDFIHLSLSRGRSLFDAIMESRVVRLRPILLTASAAMLGAVPIIIDPIFSGLAWSLIFGLFASTRFHAVRDSRGLLAARTPTSPGTECRNRRWSRKTCWSKRQRHQALCKHRYHRACDNTLLGLYPVLRPGFPPTVEISLSVDRGAVPFCKSASVT